MTDPVRYDAVVYIGRFQPYHTGHHALVSQALALGQQVVLVLGSACEARSRKNPFLAIEREAMIIGSIPEVDRPRVRFAAVPDFADNADWVATVQHAVATQVPGAQRVALLGHFKDDSSYYLNHFPGWQLESVSRANALDATAVRQVLFDPQLTMSERRVRIAAMVPAGTLAALAPWLSGETCALLPESEPNPA